MKVKVTRPLSSPPFWRVKQLQRWAWEVGNVLAVRNCCYVAVCSAARGASAPMGGGEGRGHIVAAARLQLVHIGNCQSYDCTKQTVEKAVETELIFTAMRRFIGRVSAVRIAVAYKLVANALAVIALKSVTARRHWCSCHTHTHITHNGSMLFLRKIRFCSK